MEREFFSLKIKERQTESGDRDEPEDLQIRDPQENRPMKLTKGKRISDPYLFNSTFDFHPREIRSGELQIQSKNSCLVNRKWN